MSILDFFEKKKKKILDAEYKLIGQNDINSVLKAESWSIY